ncbi:MAG: DNA sulfur modification protein DndD [Alphaproteobacteria bacterium]|nr:DNA sulfur modification protein DndD [Alphaproteobacteria bacterium]
MIFHRIVVTNLFSYNGEQVYDFTRRGEGPIALVVGRNGYGKTSLLNAVKLLFLGSDTKSQRRVGFPPRSLSRQDYLMGIKGGWAGILNRIARSGGEHQCSVRVEMGSLDSVTFTATRSWLFDRDTANERLLVTVDGEEKHGDAAQERLSNLMPRELVPFFFFDGEELQFLAESSDAGRGEAMERLLSLNYITGVEGQLADLVKEWRREALPEDVQLQMANEDGRLATIQASRRAAQHRRERISREIEDIKEEADSLSRQMDGLRASGTVSDSKRIKGDIAAMSTTLEAELAEFAAQVAADAPILANPSLVKSAIGPLAEVVDYKARSTHSVVDTAFNVLPDRLFNEPPQPRTLLTEEQRRFFENKLKRILDSYAIEDDGPVPLLESLDLSRARSLHEKFAGWGVSIGVLRQNRARHLKEISRKKAALEQRQAEWREAEFGDPERAEEYKRLEGEFAEMNRKIGGLEGDLQQLERKIADFTTQEEHIEAHKRSLERAHRNAARASERLRIAIGMRDSFHSYRKRSREAKRAQIEEAVNAHFHKLMSGHGMVDRIAIDSDFVMRFKDVAGADIGQLTISPGMRQLAVTALLWALKDLSGRPFPIIVDTPLARIDRENQDNLLVRYYPEAAEQVIILATDSEVDDRKYKLLEPHISVEFRLENLDGQSSRVVRLPFRKVAHG